YLYLSFFLLFFFYSYRDHLDLHSFPTRRSSDLSSRFLSVAQINRVSTDRSTSSPIREKRPSCRNCRSLLCEPKSRSAIPSRNSVPLCASSTRPGFVACAPVNAPFSKPKSSLSSSVPGIAAQFTFTNCPLDTAECWCIHRASTSLPLPLGPHT